MAPAIAPAELRQLQLEDSTLALVDVREHGEYNAAHIPGASSLPRRLLEFRFTRLVPCTNVRIVLTDDDGRRAALAANTVSRMGYSNVSVLDGGINRWVTEGHPTEWGMNVPSKAFGEHVETEHAVPTIDAAELQRRMKSGERIVILDARTPEEYQDFCIPTGRSMPGAELAYRAGTLLEQAPDSSVVVNCAGRTRSIIGARILQRMGMPNVVSLKNGTAGWTLAGLELEHGANRLDLPEPTPGTLAQAEAFARRLIQEDGVRLIGVNDLQFRAFQCGYQVDVRTESEYAAGHIPGFTWFPGGQAVQRADDVVAIRSADIMFCCDGLVRGAVTASWFRQMGFPNVYVVDGGTRAWTRNGYALAAGADEGVPVGISEAEAHVRKLSPQELARQSTPTMLFVGTSREFARGHVPGAHWLSRSWLELRIGSVVEDLSRPLVVTDSDGLAAALADQTLAEIGYQNVAMLDGGMRAWRAAGLPVEQGLSGVMQAPDDVISSGSERSAAETIEYLRWETNLVTH